MSVTHIDTEYEAIINRARHGDWMSVEPRDVLCEGEEPLLKDA